MKTSTALIILGVGAVGVYLLVRPSVTAKSQQKTNQNSASSAVNVKDVINAGAAVLGVIFQNKAYGQSNSNELYPNDSYTANQFQGYTGDQSVDESLGTAFSLNGLFG